MYNDDNVTQSTLYAGTCGLYIIEGRGEGSGEIWVGSGEGYTLTIQSLLTPGYLFLHLRNRSPFGSFQYTVWLLKKSFHTCKPFTGIALLARLTIMSNTQRLV